MTLVVIVIAITGPLFTDMPQLASTAMAGMA